MEPKLIFQTLATAIKNTLEKREEDNYSGSEEGLDLETDDDDDEDFNEDFEGRNDYCHMYDCPMEKIDEVIHFINILGSNQ